MYCTGFIQVMEILESQGNLTSLSFQALKVKGYPVFLENVRESLEIILYSIFAF